MAKNGKGKKGNPNGFDDPALGFTVPSKKKRRAKGSTAKVKKKRR
ncbi:MAG: hypothetical protein V3T88_06255 [Nitrosomonadaceae bacterium]